MTCAADDDGDRRDSDCAPQEDNLGDDCARLVLPGGRTVLASKHALATRCAFFKPLSDDAGPTTWGERELGHLTTVLTPGARAVLPALLEAAGSLQAPAWEPLFEAGGAIEVFAAAHLLGVADCLDAARRWVADDQFRLSAAVGKLDAKAEAASLRTAVAYGLDEWTPMKLLHAAAVADAAEATQVIVKDEDALGDVAAKSTTFCAAIDLRDAAGRTALHICAVHDSASAASVLLEASANLIALCDPPEEDSPGEADEVMAHSVMAHGAVLPVAEKPIGGVRTALHLAAAHDSVEMVQLLLERKACVAACVKGVDTAVTPLHECAATDAVRAARVLAAAAAAAAVVEEPWCEATAKMPEEEHPEEVRWSRFLDPLHAKVGLQGSTPLHTAAESDAPGVTAALLGAKADPSIGDDQGDTPLHCAVLYASPRAMGELVAHGASLLCENGSGELPLHQMAHFGDGGSELSLTLERRHFSRSLRVQADLLEALRRAGQLGSALRHAALGDCGNTPLHAVAHWDHLGAEHAAQLLVDARADLEQRNAEERTPPELARRRFGTSGRVAKVLQAASAPAGSDARQAPVEAAPAPAEASPASGEAAQALAEAVPAEAPAALEAPEAPAAL